jgi:hypothetical protein
MKKLKAVENATVSESEYQNLKLYKKAQQQKKMF